MTLSKLMSVLEKVDHDDILIEGDFGTICARRDGGCHLHTQEPTYNVEVEYRQSQECAGSKTRQSGFRFSTVCCFCAIVCLGEANVNQDVIANINAQFA